MEVQMGVGESLDLDNFAARIKPYTTSSRFENARIRTLTGTKFAWYFATLKRNVAQFRNFFYGVYDQFEWDAQPRELVGREPGSLEQRPGLRGDRLPEAPAGRQLCDHRQRRSAAGAKMLF